MAAGVGKRLLSWRIREVHGCYFVYFDPRHERVIIESLTNEEKLDMLKITDSGDAVEAEAETASQLKIPFST